MDSQELLQLLWTVVQFKQDDEENHEVSVVPSKWLINKQDGTYCYWPSSNKARKYIKKASEPNSTWKQYPVDDLLDHPVSYKDAINYEKKVEESNSSGNEFQSHRKKKPKQNNDFVEMESSSDSDIFIPPPPKLRKDNEFDAIEISSPVAKENESHNTSSDDTRSITSTELMPPPPTLPIKASDFITERTIVDIENAEIIFDNADTVPETQNWENIQISTKDHITVKLDQILKQTIENRILLERVINCISNSGSCDTGPLHYDTVPSPFKAYSDLLNYDEKLSESENMQNQLNSVFTVCGGATCKENIIRGLKKIFRDKLAKKCSWLGRKNNYAVGNLKTMHILRVAVRKNFPSLRDKEFETTVANWLRQASLRYRRQKSRGATDI
ncbi:unnamed protein product [Callosobruchus maculatus]|uniref:DUF4806 domain-containing protein n=2 Tax=Callosobruchus maculatus TaxID=64391 RepID=A0A653DA06_CALMS|nr:unnamed protein product [Callosobruchus maculatus]